MTEAESGSSRIGNNPLPNLRKACQIMCGLSCTMTTPRLLYLNAGKNGGEIADRTALIYFAAEISYAQLLQSRESRGCGLQALGVKKATALALFMSNCPQFVNQLFWRAAATAQSSPRPVDVHAARGDAINGTVPARQS